MKKAILMAMKTNDQEKKPKQPLSPTAVKSPKSAFGSSKAGPESQIQAKPDPADILAAYMNKMDFAQQLPYWIPQSTDVVLDAIDSADKANPRVRAILTEMVELGRMIGLYPEVIATARKALENAQ